MVLEALVNPIKAARKPWETFFIGMVYSSTAVIVSLILFKEFSSIVMIALTSLVSVPFVYGAIKLEEKKDLEINEERKLMREHGKVLTSFIFLFLGFVISFSLWYVFLPAGLTESLFQVQINMVNEINSPVTGSWLSISSTIGKILLNNFKVLAFCLLFAFFYGFGAIFILTWNATVFATLVGAFIKNNTGSYLLAPLIMLKYSLHGIPEIFAYFMAGLAGGIISIAVVRHDFGSKKFKRILIDSFDLIVGAVFVLLVSVLIEVFISPSIL
ncbi:stage II sporulation protein M [Nanoarchaeota archaeon]